jgi:hypothetical protein
LKREVLKGPGRYWEGVIAGRFRNRERGRELGGEDSADRWDLLGSERGRGVGELGCRAGSCLAGLVRPGSAR